jgi:hypothetical protein
MKFVDICYYKDIQASDTKTNYASVSMKQGELTYWNFIAIDSIMRNQLDRIGQSQPPTPPPPNIAVTFHTEEKLQYICYAVCE